MPTIYCLVCGTGREAPQLKLSFLKNIFINLLFSQLLFWGSLLFFDLPVSLSGSLVAFAVGFLFFESVQYVNFKKKIKCPVCHFDFSHYKKLKEVEKQSYLQQLMQAGENTWKRWYQFLNQSIDNQGSET